MWLVLFGFCFWTRGNSTFFTQTHPHFLSQEPITPPTRDHIVDDLFRCQYPFLRVNLCITNLNSLRTKVHTIKYSPTLVSTGGRVCPVFFVYNHLPNVPIPVGGDVSSELETQSSLFPSTTLRDKKIKKNNNTREGVTLMENNSTGIIGISPQNKMWD